MEQDYILRLIAMAGEMVRRAMEKARSGEAAEALELLDEAVKHIVNTSPGLLARLTPDGLVTFLGAGGPVDPLIAAALAEALEAKADALADLGRSAESDLHRRQASALHAAAHMPPDPRDGGT